MTIPVIFDTDAGSDIDDLFALALILASPELELQGVTTVAGDTLARARLVAKMLRLADRGDVPVAAGIRIPAVLAARGMTEASYRQHLSHTQVVEAGDAEANAGYPDGVGFILERLASAARPITLIATGPWTNVAAVVQRADARQKTAIAAVCLMGGEIHRPYQESNVVNDPEGAAVVLASGLPLFVGTWSVTRRLFFTMAEIETHLGSTSDPFLAALYQATRYWWGEGISTKPGPVLYDVAPVYWAAGRHDAFACLEFEALRVEVQGAYTRGMTIPHPGGPLWSLAKARQQPRPAASSRLLVTDDMTAAELKTDYAARVFGVAPPGSAAGCSQRSGEDCDEAPAGNPAADFLGKQGDGR